MSLNNFLILWLCSFGVILACRILPLLLLRGRALSPRVTEALGYIPPAAFAALVANDLIVPGALSAGFAAAAVSWAASALVVGVALKTRSMLACCVVGTVCYVLLSLLV